MNSAPESLKHQFLIAMPQLADSSFAGTLIYLIEHGPHGAMGLVINKPIDMNLADIMQQLQPDNPAQPHCLQTAIHAGGPVQPERGFVLHPNGWHYQHTLELGSVAMSTSEDALLAIADGSGPQRCLIALGYAGWAPGQLETELLDNAWLTCPADPAILFDTPSAERLDQAAASLGIDLHLLSRQAGHA